MDKILEIKNLTKIYNDAGGEIRVLDDISLDVERGKFIVFIGPSGSGFKSYRSFGRGYSRFNTL